MISDLSLFREELIKAARNLIQEVMSDNECALCHWTDEDDQPHELKGTYLGRVCPCAAVEVLLRDVL